jgi:hypothetical protein
MSTKAAKKKEKEKKAAAKTEDVKGMVASTPKASAPAPVDADKTNFALEVVEQDDIEELVENRAVVKVYNSVTITEADMISLLPAEIGTMGVKGRGMIQGVNAAMVMKSFLTSLIAARRAANPIPLIYCGVLAVAIAYTVSREWVAEYEEIPSPHMFTEFEIQGRKKKIGNSGGAADDWVEDHDMNAAALRVFGSMVVEAGASSSFLKQLKTEAGSIFTPPTGEKARDKIMKVAAAEVGPADREALDEFKKHAGAYASLVGAVFGGGALDIKAYVEVADMLGVVYI